MNNINIIQTNTGELLEIDKDGNYKKISLNKACKKFDKNPDTIRRRMKNNNISFEQAIQLETNYNKTKITDPNTGELMIASDLAKRYNMNPDTFLYRLNKLGWSVEKILNTPVDSTKNQPKYITSNLGDTLSYGKWDKALGFADKTISRRKNEEKLSDYDALYTGIINVVYFEDDSGNIIPQNKKID